MGEIHNTVLERDMKHWEAPLSNTKSVAKLPISELTTQVPGQERCKIATTLFKTERRIRLVRLETRTGTWKTVLGSI
jgi:hypothetical protein